MYCASKFAVRAITQAAGMPLASKASLYPFIDCIIFSAQEFKAHGINVLAYAPGFIKTPLSE